MASRKFQVTVSKTVTTRDVNMRLELHEADAHAPQPGALYGSITLVDEGGEVLGRRTLTPEDAEPLTAAVEELKQSTMAILGVEEVANV